MVKDKPTGIPTTGEIFDAQPLDAGSLSRLHIIPPVSYLVLEPNVDSLYTITVGFSLAVVDELGIFRTPNVDS